VIFFANLKTGFSYTVVIARGGAFMRHVRNFFVLVITTVLLASCNLTQVFPRADINFSLIESTTAQPNYTRTQINVLTSVNAAGALTTAIEQVRVLANANSGSMGAVISDYSISYFYGDGTAIPTASGQPFRGSVILRVPAGLKCPNVAPDNGTGDSYGKCSVNTEGSQAVAGDNVVSGSFFPIDSDIIGTLLTSAKSRNEAYAVITLTGRDANGNAYSDTLDPVTIIFTAK
jgi:hypothetical protein